jgi:hypothetical protein
MTPAERMRRLRERRKATGLKPVVAWIPKEPGKQATYSSHRLLEARSLAANRNSAAWMARASGENQQSQYIWYHGFVPGSA